MPNVKNNLSAQDTQRRLLEAAGIVFAERGFHSATIKDITDRAGAALASVNYHFRDKTELYAAVIRRIQTDAARIVPPVEEQTGPAISRLRRAILHVVQQMIRRGQPPWERILMARELAQPSPALDPLIETVGRPLHERLGALIAEATGRREDDDAVILATSSVIGQCLYHVEHQSLIHRLHPQLHGELDTDQIADHIAEFSLAGIRAMARRPEANGHKAAAPRKRRRRGGRP
ncbi:MAG TPA: CerR family C-terminal domain-containing protein [Candidatus Limnocylindrales bacterium]|nr:CerR family C-terminal domain-containing protein [Candidatus Limnocylindrales bacterium]